MAETLAMISAFEKRTACAFPNLGVSRKDFASALRAQVQNPLILAQRDTSLCGPAAFVFAFAKKNSMAYAKYAMDLYENGRAWLGKMEVVPSADCKAWRRPVSTQGVIEPVDWVALASIRDSSNLLLDYDEPSDRVAGITGARSIESWFSRCGYFPTVLRSTNLVRNKSLWALLCASRERTQGAHPALLIGADLLTKQSGGTLIPNHWVVLGSDVRVGSQYSAALLARGETAVASDTSLLAQTISFQVYTWGTSWVLPGSTTVSTFLDYFYGFVAGR
ncbi:MAG: hypothetical protein RL385_433 [Pseudomonadota bacterium]